MRWLGTGAPKGYEHSHKSVARSDRYPDGFKVVRGGAHGRFLEPLPAGRNPADSEPADVPGGRTRQLAVSV